MDRIYPRTHHSDSFDDYPLYEQNQTELFDIAQIGQLFDNEEYVDKITLNRAASPSIIANDLKRSMHMHFYSNQEPINSNMYREPNSTETSPGVQTSNDSPYSTCSSNQQNYSYEDRYRNDMNNFPYSNKSKRTSVYSPEIKRKIFLTEQIGQQSNNFDVAEDEEDPVENDDFYLDIKEEKLFNDSFDKDSITSPNYNNSYSINTNLNLNLNKNNISNNLIINNNNQNNESINYNTDIALNPNSNNNATKLLNNRTFKNIKFANWNEIDWAEIYTQSYEKINTPVFQVEADKGFFYSKFDEAFVCQKKNHFQITTHTLIDKIPAYCKSKTDTQFYQIDKFILQLYGIKQESPMQKIQIKQSDSDRKPIEYEPIECKFLPEQSNKITKMRLHFAHTTNNNNRKRNKSGQTIPNPDQRYFLLIVEVQIVTKAGKFFTLCSSASERVIVRAVNPGQFKQETNDEKSTQPSNKQTNFDLTTEPNETLDIKPIDKKQVFFGKVGINTENPDESLTVVGNIKLTGNLLQPSDVRVKENIEPIDANKALENVTKLKVYKYDYKKEFADVNGGLVNDYGVLAQHVQEIIPEAVVESGDVVLADGQVIKNFLNVNKNRIHMECVGAVIALDDKTKDLNKKIESIEKIINETSSNSASNGNTKQIDNTNETKSKSFLKDLFKFGKKPNDNNSLESSCLNKKTFKIIIMLCIIIIAFGIIGILVVQILQHNREPYDFGNKTAHGQDFLNKNDTFFYPKVNPPVIVSPTCNFTQKKCRFCCADESVPKLSNDFVNNLTTVKAVSLGEWRLSSSKTSGTINDAKTALNNALLSVILFSNNPVIYVNLTLTNNCPSPYCEEINGVYYFFIPLSSNIDTKIQFNLAFFLRQGFILRNCNIQKNGCLCPKEKYDSSIFQEPQYLNSSLNGYRDIFDNAKKYIFYAPITYFMHIDFEFRTYMEFTNTNGLDICLIKPNTINSKNVLYKEYVFRFYRIC